MNKKLAAKLQKLVPLVGESEVVFSSSLAIEPPERELVLKKGNVYTTFDIYSPVELNVSLVSKVINDVLYDSYYHSENISPIQSLERAIVNISEKISTLAAEEASAKPAVEKKAGKVIFNTVSCVLWGNVLYMVQYGKGKSFLMREGGVKDVASTVEGNFSVASGVVKNGDVVVLSTSKFAEKYPPDKLLGSALSSKDLAADCSCLILKFMVDEEFTEDEVIDFEVRPDKKSSILPGILRGMGGRKKEPKQKDQAIASLVDTPSPIVPIKPVRETVLETSASLAKLKKSGPNIKIKRGGLKSKLNLKALTAVVSVMLLVSVFVTFLIRNNQSSGDQAQNQGQEGSSLFVPREFTQNETQPQPPQEAVPKPEQALEEAKKEQDILNKVARVDAQPFYDIKLADENAAPADIVLFTNTVVVTDPVSGKIFTSDSAAPKFTALEKSFPGIKGTMNFDGRLNFSDAAGYKSFSLNDGSVVDSFDGSFGLTSRYLGNIYSLEENSIMKYVPSGDTLNSTTWATDDTLSNAKALGIAYNIYVVSADNNLLVYTQGEKSTFSVTGLDTPLSKVTDLYVDVNFDYIYLADAGNNRVVVLNTEGEFVKQIKARDEAAWSDIKSLSLNTAETKMFLLNGSKVFEIDLATAEVAGAATAAKGTSLPETEAPAEEPEEPVGPPESPLD